MNHWLAYMLGLIISFSKCAPTFGTSSLTSLSNWKRYCWTSGRPTYRKYKNKQNRWAEALSINNARCQLQVIKEPSTSKWHLQVTCHTIVVIKRMYCISAQPRLGIYIHWGYWLHKTFFNRQTCNNLVPISPPLRTWNPPLLWQEFKWPIHLTTSTRNS